VRGLEEETMKNNTNIGLIVIILVVTLQGCVTTSLNIADQIIGQWQSNIGGFPLIVEYSNSNVQVGTSEPVAYQLSGSELTFADGAGQVRLVSFPDKNRMFQMDPITGTSHEFKRVTR